MKSLILILVTVLFLSGCATASKIDRPSSGALVSQLTVDQVIEIAMKRAGPNGFMVEKSGPWQISLNASAQPYEWTVMPGGIARPSGYWIVVNDKTGAADFVQPMLQLVEPPAGSDWLAKTQRG